MFKQTVTYEGFEGEEVQEDVYLNLTAAELAELHFDYDTEGGFETYLIEILRAGDNKKLFAAFKMLLLKAYGRRDGNRFIKKAEWQEEFASSQAYSAIFLSLATDPAKASAFFNQIMPKDLQEKVAELEKNKTATVDLPESGEPAWVQENRFPTKKELQAMSPEELARAMAAKAGS